MKFFNHNLNCILFLHNRSLSNLVKSTREPILKAPLLICTYVRSLTLRISALDLNKLKVALTHRSAILERSLAGAEEAVKPEDKIIWGEGVKIMNKCTPNRKPFTQAEKEDFVVKYNSGMSIGAIAREYDCNHSTVGRILRRMGANIRD